MTTLSDYLVSLVRTAVPIGVGLALTLFATKTGININGETAQLLVTGLVISGYYAAVRALEVKWHWFGVLLGWKVAPTYTPPAVTEASAEPSYPIAPEGL
jgi:hypothetical protein